MDSTHPPTAFGGGSLGACLLPVSKICPYSLMDKAQPSGGWNLRSTRSRDTLKGAGFDSSRGNCGLQPAATLLLRQAPKILDIGF